ncbi:hypothetical protein BJF78_06795 [Pseudonocardia sp. CNS-139]|nr:hypothetical protein BJF78_06795 [Pseudonocardia sp. CNS-139]
MTAVDASRVGERPVPAHIAAAMRASEAGRRRLRRRETAVVRVCQLLTVVAVLAAWEGLVRLGVVRELFVSRPMSVVTYLIDERVELLVNAQETFLAALVGFAIGSGAGVLSGVALGWWRPLGRIFDPWVTFLASLPRIALAPLFLLWFGITFQAKVVLAVSIVYFVVLVGTQAGMRSADPDLRRSVTLLGGNGRDELLKAVLPDALPAVFGALRLGVIFSLLGVVASEMIASRVGLGQLIVRSSQELRPEGVLAMLILLGGRRYGDQRPAPGDRGPGAAMEGVTAPAGAPGAAPAIDPTSSAVSGRSSGLRLGFGIQFSVVNTSAGETPGRTRVTARGTQRCRWSPSRRGTRSIEQVCSATRSPMRCAATCCSGVWCPAPRFRSRSCASGSAPAGCRSGTPCAVWCTKG